MTIYMKVIVFIILTAIRTNAAKNSKIIGGSTVNITEYPNLLFINLTDAYCTGSIISASWALTAAHCLYGEDTPSGIILRAGSSNRTSGGSLHVASAFQIHPNYRESYPIADYDFGVIQVETPFPIGYGVQAIKLASIAPTAGTEVTASGWGLTTNPAIASILGQTVPETLKSTTLKVRNRFWCSLIYLPSGFTPRMLCASSYTSNICLGDSGGPLVSKKTGEQVGIASKGTRIFRCLRGIPAVFANVASQIDWIKNITGI